MVEQDGKGKDTEALNGRCLTSTWGQGKVANLSCSDRITLAASFVSVCGIIKM